MKSKILALSKNEEFKALVKGNKLSNKYVTIFFKVIKNKLEFLSSKKYDLFSFIKS